MNIPNNSNGRNYCAKIMKTEQKLNTPEKGKQREKCKLTNALLFFWNTSCTFFSFELLSLYICLLVETCYNFRWLNLMAIEWMLNHKKRTNIMKELFLNKYHETCTTTAATNIIRLKVQGIRKHHSDRQQRRKHFVSKCVHVTSKDTKILMKQMIINK